MLGISEVCIILPGLVPLTNLGGCSGGSVPTVMPPLLEACRMCVDPEVNCLAGKC